MKYLISTWLLLFSTILHAQTNSTKPKQEPSIPVSKSVSTTVITQPSSMPGSNTNPTTGTVIKLKSNKNASSSGRVDTISRPITNKIKSKKKKRN